MFLSTILLGAILIFLSLVLNSRNSQYLLAGYNTMSEEERETIDIDGLIKSLKFVMFLTGALTLLCSFVLWWVSLEQYTFSIFIVVSLIFLISILRIKSKYKPTPIYSDKRKIVFFTIAGLLTFVLPVFFVIYVLVSASSDPEFLITDSKLKIEGFYGEEIQLSNIKSISLVDQLPEIIRRTNGSDFSGRLKGMFSSKEGKVYLNVYLRRKPFLRIVTTNKLMYINNSNSNTNSLYQNIFDKLKR